MRKGICLSLAIVLILELLPLWRTASAVEVLEPGYVVQTYASYSCPEMIGPPSGVEFDCHWNLYLSQWEVYRSKGGIYRINSNRTGSKWMDMAGTPRRIVWAGGTSYGQYLYVSDATSYEVLRVGLDGTASLFCHLSDGPHSLALDRTGNYGGYLYIATRHPDRIYAVSETGDAEVFSQFPGSVPGGHVDLTFDPGTKYGGLMYAALEHGNPPHKGNYGLFAVDQDGNARKFAPNIVTAHTVQIDPYGMLKDDLFVSGKCKCKEDEPYNIWRVDPDGSTNKFAVGTIGDKDLLTFTLGSHGDLYVPEYSPDEKVVIVNRILPGTLR
ncbi:MAG: SMP-30/gluconolactonase/LRE family protein [Planctomycetota bacterium]|jgi:hypothetical protein